MSFIQGMTTSFKEELLKGIHDLTTDNINVALYTSVANFGPSTTAYNVADAGQLVSAGYVAGGQKFTNGSVSTNGLIAYLDFDDMIWTTSSTPVTIRGALMYNKSKANRSVAVLDFGIDRVLTGSITLSPPLPNDSTAIIRIK